jgi:hypothetical protein
MLARALMTTSTNTDLKTELKKSLELLRALRDEVRLQLHLGGMEARHRWDELEPRLASVEQAAQEATEASRAAVREAIAALKELSASLKR